MKRKLNEICMPAADNIWILPASNNGKYPYCYTFLITGDENILLDPGRDFDKLKELRDTVDIDRVVISHSHPDHFAGAWIFEGLPVLFPVESPEKVYDINFLAERATGGGKAAELWIKNMRELMDLRPPVPTGSFANGDIIVKGPSLRLKAILAPGHSRDHYVFFDECSGILFSSDIDFTGFGPWYGYRECSINDFRRSLNLLRSLPVKMILPSHSEKITGNIPAEIDNYENGIERQKDKLRDLLRGTEGKTLDELTDASPFYKTPGKTTLNMRKIEGCMIGHLLAEMVEQGEAAAEETVTRKDGERRTDTRYTLRSG